MNPIPIGIMQGRLSPRYRGRYQAFPPEHWMNEFATASELGFDGIEFIFDYDNYENSPLLSDEGLLKISELQQRTGVLTPSICADYFMRFPLHVSDDMARKKSIKILNELIVKSKVIGVSDIIIPCVDESSLKGEEDIAFFKDSVASCLASADIYGIDINLETDLPPHEFLKLVADIDHPRLKINYDIGNSASSGYSASEEIQAYGRYVSILHVKDRLRGGGSVRLGSGAANFEAVFKELRQTGFNGIITMQAARANNDEGDFDIVREQFLFLTESLEKWFYHGA
jgi:hexulose-6-phosphate isomerase